MPLPKSILNQKRSDNSALETVHLISQYPSLDDQDIEELLKALNISQINIKKLILNDNDISDEGVEKIAALQSLDTLSVAANGITDKGAESISRMSNLTSLDISGNQITYLGLQHILTLPNLTSLILSGNQISEKIKADFLKNRKLTKLIVLGNRNSGILKEIQTHVENNKNYQKTKSYADYPLVKSKFFNYPALKALNKETYEQFEREIFSFLDARDLSKIAITSKAGKEISEQEELWKEIVLKNLTNNPKLEAGESYRSFYQRWFDNLIKYIDRLESVNSVLPQNCTYKGKYPLYVAVKLNFEPLVINLLAKGANPEIIVEKSEEGEIIDSVFHLAVSKGYDRMLKLLLSSSKMDFITDLIDQPCSDGRTLFYDAVLSGNTSSVKLLLNAGASVNQCDYMMGVTPLHEAVYQGNLELVKILLIAGADPNEPEAGLNEDNRTPLHDAVLKGNFEIVKTILSYIAEQGRDILETAINMKGFINDDTEESIFDSINRFFVNEELSELKKILSIIEHRPEKRMRT